MNYPEYYDLYDGTHVTKVSRAGKGQRRCIFVEASGLSLIWKSKRKGSDESKVKFQDVTSIVLGQVTERFAKYKHPERAELSLSINYAQSTFDVIFEDKATLDKWYRNLILFRDIQLGIVKHVVLLDDNTKMAIHHWQKAPKSSQGRMTSREIRHVYNTINAAWSDSKIKQQIKDHDKNGDESLDLYEFLSLFHQLCVSEAVLTLYKTYFRNVNSAEESILGLQEFYRDGLQDHIELPQLKRKLKEIDIQDGEIINVQKFSAFLLSDFNSILAPYADEVTHDMTQPLAHYYINSSHNTYLEGDQLASKSSVEMYKQALHLGCRCVELDCWDGDTEPIIYHGHTMTSRISFDEVIKKCFDAAFTSSQYPVILSLENHCSVEFQRMMAVSLVRHLGDSLALSYVGESIDRLESPAQLMRKFLIKGSTLPMNEILLAKGKIAPSVESIPANQQYESEDDDDDDEAQPESASGSTRKSKPAEAKKSKAKVAAELSEKVYLKNTKFVDFPTSRAKGRVYEMSSFAERKTESLCKTQGAEFLEYNRRQLSRIYPGGHRVDSSNYDPSLAWSRGCQIVALNYQTASTPMFVNLGKFRENKNSGYLLKPSYMLSGNYDPSAKIEPIVSFKVTIIAGFRLPKPSMKTKGEVIDPYVKLIVQGHPDDEFEDKTRTINDNGWDPVWEETFTFHVSHTKEAVVVLAVYDKDVNRDDFIGYYSLPVGSMRRGYRFVPLHDKNHSRVPRAGLLCKIVTENRA